MNETTGAVIAIICAYILGSIPFPYLVTRFVKKVDIREIGSHNMGAMNTFYQTGFAWGLLVLLLDMAKGIGAVLIARALTDGPNIPLIAAGVAVIGHMYPVFLKFKGGKGGATVVGIFVITMWWEMIPVGLGTFVLMLLLTRFPTFSYAVALMTGPLVAWLGFEDGRLVIATLILLAMVLAKYIPRLKEMRLKGGNWRRVFVRKGLKDRL
ncbi:MAG: hypothetical protein GX631_06390 [Dehalococcoidales bacterium]|jgi:glycerol-3-phosphate acyltransferase PlsY|nr:hypothetical protein [Dehalococcoidales bacterium]